MVDTLAQNNQVEESNLAMLKEKNELVGKIKSYQEKLVVMERSLEKKDEQHLSVVEINRKIQAKLLDYETMLEDLRREKSLQQDSFSNQKEELDASLRSAQRKVSQTKLELNKVMEENYALKDQLEETKKLFQRSCEALISKRKQYETTIFEEGHEVKKSSPALYTADIPVLDLPCHTACHRVPPDTIMPSNGTPKGNQRQYEPNRKGKYVGPQFKQSDGNINNHELPEHFDGPSEKQNIEVDAKESANKSFISEITFCNNIIQKDEATPDSPKQQNNLPTIEKSNNESILDESIASVQVEIQNNETDKKSSVAEPTSTNNSQGVTLNAELLFESSNNKHDGESVGDQDERKDQTKEFDDNQCTKRLQDKSYNYGESDFESESKTMLVNEGAVIEDNGNLSHSEAQSTDELPELPSHSEMNEITNNMYSNKAEQSQKYASCLAENDEVVYEDSFEVEEEPIQNDHDPSCAAMPKPNGTTPYSNNNSANDESNSVDTGKSSSQFESSVSTGIQVYSSRNKINANWW